MNERSNSNSSVESTEGIQSSKHIDHSFIHLLTNYRLKRGIRSLNELSKRVSQQYLFNITLLLSTSKNTKFFNVIIDFYTLNA